MTTNRSETESESMLNHLLIKIVISLGGTVVNSDKNSLLKSWLSAIGG